jgi:sec-independent protein translocase protein TatA
MLPGNWEWIIILVIVLLVFGIGRISRLGSEMGKGIREFRKGLREGQQPDPNEEEGEKHPEQVE